LALGVQVQKTGTCLNFRRNPGIEERFPPGLQESKYKGQGKAYIPGIQEQRTRVKLYSRNPVIENKSTPRWKPRYE
jgi:hypothetical protein